LISVEREVLGAVLGFRVFRMRVVANHVRGMQQITIPNLTASAAKNGTRACCTARVQFQFTFAAKNANPGTKVTIHPMQDARNHVYTFRSHPRHETRVPTTMAVNRNPHRKPVEYPLVRLSRPAVLPAKTGIPAAPKN